MSRFAVLSSVGGPVSILSHELSAIRSDMRRRDGPAGALLAEDGRCFMQAEGGKIARRGPLTLCGDLGLTDLAQLRDLVGTADADSPEQLIMARWLQRGAAALQDFCGSFAFCLHDRRSNALWVVRDRMGIRPILYAATKDRIVIASTISAVLAGLDERPEISAEWVADFLAGQETDASRTAHSGIHRLEPGQVMRFAEGRRVAPEKWYDLGSRITPCERDASEALREALAHATAQRCMERPTAVLLSGGLDSSSLALLSVRQGQSRPALSLRYDDPAMDEGGYIDMVLSQGCGRLKPVDLRAAFDLPPHDQGQPVFAPGLPDSRQLYAAARALGCSEIIDGHGGDEVIDGGPWTIGQIARQGHWAQALALTWKHARFVGTSPLTDCGQLIATHGDSRILRKLTQFVAGPVEDRMAWRALVDPHLAAATDLVERVRAYRAGMAESRLPLAIRDQVALLGAPLTATALEILDAAARDAGVTPHYPFYDHRVIEICAAQPDHARIHGGQPRSLLREAMRGILPEKIRQRTGKTNFLPHFWLCLTREKRVARMLANPASLQGWVNIDRLRADGQRLRNPVPDARTAFRLSRALSLADWLEAREAAPSKPAIMETT
ncbi:asparagine synthase-related protein [Paracoccus ravus]|uniref:asparagine synthase-related protein n=1 Tax=Paracoccus ravus TaxID=2447760 RepID=UPI00106EA76F|nr:asparagine synthase-related protein [Paracoccus ravus]